MEPVKFLCSDTHGMARTLTLPPFAPDFCSSVPCIDLDQAKPGHKILGFGGAVTDAAAWVIARLPEESRNALIRDFFGKDGLNLSIVRMNAGACDYSTGIYSYDDVPDDVELKHFSIAHDEEFLIPLVKQIRTFREDLFLFASPWSPPGWMKTGGSMCGGDMRWKYLPVFADYLVKYLKAYRAHGLEIDAVTLQNEPETDQYGTMPQSRLHPDFEMELAARLMPSRLKKAGLHTKLWIHDHNYTGWKRVCYMLSDPEVRSAIDAVAFHPYAGSPEILKTISEQYPGTQFQLTEKGPNIRDFTCENKLSWWANTISGAINNGCSSFCGWNYALDENGYPKTGSFDCAGLITVHSQTGEITPSAQYHAFRHFAPFIQRNAEVMSWISDRAIPQGISVLICRNPDGSMAAVVGSDQPEDRRFPERIQLKYHNRYLQILLPSGDSLSTIVF